MFPTDMLDNVSERYATYDEIGVFTPTAPRNTWPATSATLRAGVTDGTQSHRSSRRGNPGLPDNFSYFSFEVSYKFRQTLPRTQNFQASEAMGRARARWTGPAAAAPSVNFGMTEKKDLMDQGSPRCSVMTIRRCLARSPVAERG